MPQQGVIDWTTLANRARLAECGLTERQIDMILCVVQNGQRYRRGGDDRWLLRISTRKLQALLGWASNSTVRSVAARLSGLMTAAGERVFVGPPETPGEYRVSRNGLAALGPDEPRESDPLDQKGERGWAEPGEGGRGARTRKNVNLKSVDRNRDSERARCDRPAPPNGAQSNPWDRECGVTGEQLRAAVRFKTKWLLKWLWDEAVRQGWFRPSEDARLRFLTIAHHCCQPGIHRPMGLLLTRCRDGLDVSKIRSEHEDWARSLLRDSTVGEAST